MNMKNNFSVAGALALSLLVAPACSKDKSGGDKAAPGEKKVSAGSATTSGEGLSAADAIAYMPADTEIVVGFNIGSLTSSAMWKEFGEAALSKAPKEYKELKALCGFDPLMTVKSVYVGVNSAMKDAPVIIVNGLGREQISSCLKAVAKKEGHEITAVDDGNITFFSGGTDKKQGVAWINDTTLLVVPQNSDKEHLSALAAGKNGLKDNAAFGAVVAKVKQSQPVWFAGSFKKNSPALQNMGMMPSVPTGFYGSLGISDGLDIALGAVFADEAAAKSSQQMLTPLMGMAKGQLGPAGDLVDKVKVATAGTDLTINLKLTDADVAKLKALAGPMLGGMGGPK